MIFLKVEDFLVFFLEEAGGEQESESESGNRPIDCAPSVSSVS
jgi:hypothetical protein